MQFAAQGFAHAWRHESTFRREPTAAIIPTPLGLWLDQAAYGRVLLITCLLLVTIVELLNSAVAAGIDVITSERVGALDENLREACLRALELDHRDCRAFVEDRSWRKSTLQVERYLSPRTRATAAAQPDSSASH